ncbi:PAS domain-containing protein [Labrys wisconsinensis]|uniref:PAS domain S-box-containing protein n=1 Tax=Labrys wisconsinensis TaxID=425677 RepID=A0ABU0J7P5_9HYPH|nr:PAS domain-containing protein [Labrys wisconsinensis]MDQ0470288.1 PAS domain S-box-containing protein [Labrys wisconsinensis]
MSATAPDLPIGPALAEAILHGGAEAIVATDRDGIIRFWNPGAARLFGFEADEALGRTLDLIVPEPQRERHWQGYRRVMATGTSRYGAGEVLAVPATTRDGRRISIEFTITPLHGAGGSIVGLAAVLRDVTGRFEELKALRRSMKELVATAMGMRGGEEKG